MKCIYIIILALTLAGPAAFAQDPSAAGPKPLTFAAWRDQQVLEGQNQVLRASARVAQLKSGKTAGKFQEPADLPSNTKVKKVGDSETLAAAEQDLKRAQETAETASKAQFEDYVEVYIPSLMDRPEAVQKLAEKLTREELIEIFKLLMRKPSPSDAKRNTALVGALNRSARFTP